MKSLAGIWGGLAVILALALLSLPFLVLILQVSPGELAQVALANGGVIITSLSAACLSLLLVLLLGTPVAFLLARGKFPGKILVESMVILPLVTPPLVMGILLVFIYGPYAFLGRFMNFTDVFPGMVLAETYVAFPYYVLAARAAFTGVPVGLENASAMLGRSPGETFWRITLPLARNGLLAGAAMAWARALGEFGATVIIAYHPYGLPVKIWVDLNDAGLPQALPLAALLLLVAVPIPLIALLWSRENAQG